MTKAKPAAEPASNHAASQERRPARLKDRDRTAQTAKQKADDMPGAEGPLSAGASEDTYD